MEFYTSKYKTIVGELSKEHPFCSPIFKGDHVEQGTVFKVLYLSPNIQSAITLSTIDGKYQIEVSSETLSFAFTKSDFIGEQP
jgi:hypothetical protein